MSLKKKLLSVKDKNKTSPITKSSCYGWQAAYSNAMLLYATCISTHCAKKLLHNVLKCKRCPTKRDWIQTQVLGNQSCDRVCNLLRSFRVGWKICYHLLDGPLAGSNYNHASTRLLLKQRLPVECCAEPLPVIFCHVCTDCPGAALPQLQVPPFTFRQHYIVN